MGKRAAERQRFRIPRVAIREDSGAVILEAEMPGIEKNDFEINVEGDELTIRGKRKPQDSDRKILRQESDTSDYLRTFVLGEEIDTSNIEAKLNNGILILTLHKKKEAAPQKIAITSA